MRAVAAHSDDPDTDAAVAELLAQLDEGLAGAKPAAAFLFANMRFDHARVLAAITARWPGLPLIGGSSDAEGSSALGYCEDSLCALLLVGELAVGVGWAPLATARPREAGRLAAEHALKAVPQPALCVTVVESFTGTSARATAGMTDVLGPLGVPLFGGASSDDQGFEKTLQIAGGEVLTDHVVVMALGGALEMAHAVGSGFQPIGRGARVTRAVDNVVYEVDGCRALEHYRAYLGHLTQPSSHFPLAIVDNDAVDVAATIRTPLFADDATGAITFAGDVPEGSTLSLADTDGRDGVIAAAVDAVARASAGLGAPADVVLFFSCTGRRDLLGTRSREECDALGELLPGVPFIGFYGYGEIGPVGASPRVALHNHTFVCVALRERS